MIDFRVSYRRGKDSRISLILALFLLVTVAPSYADSLTSRSVREASSFAADATISPLNLPFPTAWGVNLSFVPSSSWMFSVDYLRSSAAIEFFSYELGSLSEDSYALEARRFFGNSFNLKFGVGQRFTEAKLAKSYYDLSNNSYSETASKIRSDFVRFGFGNQWQLNRHVSLTVDWFTINVPYGGDVITSASKYASSSSNKEDIEDIESILKYYPSGSIVQAEIGVMF